jgi:hypothetical protein
MGRGQMNLGKYLKFIKRTFSTGSAVMWNFAMQARSEEIVGNKIYM